MLEGLYSGTTLIEVVCCLKGTLPIADSSSHSYAMPTKTMEVLQLQDQGSKMFLDSVLTTHERVVQVGILGET